MVARKRRFPATIPIVARSGPKVASIHSRALRYEHVPSELIRVRPFREDPLFTRHFQKVLLGKTPVALTRLDTSKITSGFYVWENGQALLVDDPPEAEINQLVSMLRDGHRPALYIYWSDICPKESKYVCPDDQNLLAAYRQAGIHLAPVRVMAAQPQRLVESAVLIKGDPSQFSGTMIRHRDAVETWFGAPSPPLTEVIAQIDGACAKIITAIENFDQNDGGEPHYHQFIKAAVIRHRRISGSIGLLAKEDRSDHCFALMRLAYESALNTYVDWLSPDWFGVRFQYLSIQRQAEADARSGRKLAKSIDRVIDIGTVKFLESAEQKGRIYPSTEYFYRLAYPRMSSYSHQDYGILVDVEIEQLMPDPNAIERDRTLANWLDVISAPILTRLADDVGETNSFRTRPSFRDTPRSRRS